MELVFRRLGGPLEAAGGGGAVHGGSGAIGGHGPAATLPKI